MNRKRSGKTQAEENNGMIYMFHDNTIIKPCGDKINIFKGINFCVLWVVLKTKLPLAAADGKN